METKAFAQIKLERIHVVPRALELSSQSVQQRFAVVWDPLEELLTRMKDVPVGLLRFWLTQPNGHVVITHLPSGYAPGREMLKRHVLCNVAYVSVADLAKDTLDALVPVGQLLDHMLGNGGSDAGMWLSEGGGVTPAVREIGRRVSELFPLGYGFDMAARASARDYWARSFALYLTDREALNVADPLMERLLRTTLFWPVFWRSKQM
jgi:hypothetical protein